MSMSRAKSALVAAVLIAVVGTSLAGAAGSGSSVTDPRADSKALKRKPELDIRRASVADESGRRVKHKISMQGKLKPQKKFTRPFLLINTRGNSKSRFEYLVLGPRVFRRVGDNYEKVGANKFTTKRKTWIYRFKPGRIGLGVGDSYGWAVLTAKGKTVDLAPDARYVTHRIGKPPAAGPNRRG